MSNLINCGTCGYPLAPEERTTLVEKDGVMVKPWVGLTKEDCINLSRVVAVNNHQIRAVEMTLKAKNQ